VGNEKLTKEEKELGLAFDMKYIPGTSENEKMKNHETEIYGVIKAISSQGIINWAKLNEIIRA